MDTAPRCGGKRELDMKKLICALMLMVMLMPVMAMAACTLPEKLDIDNLPANIGLTINDCKVRYKYVQEDGAVKYTGHYYLTGALDMVTVNYDLGPEYGGGGCMAEFGASGIVKDIRIGKNCTMDSHDFKSPLTVALKTGEEANRPDDTIFDVAERYGWDPENNSFLTTLKGTPDLSGDSGTGINYVGNDRESFGVSYANGNKRFVHYGPIVYGRLNDEYGTVLRVYGDKDKNINFWADYDPETGKLDHYGMFTDDGSIETVYNAKNVLISTEVWTKDGAYWGYFEGEWSYAANGDWMDAEPVGSDNLPNEEVLKKIALSPRAANFDVEKASSLNGVKEVGTPVVIGGGNKKITTVASMDDWNKSTYEMQVEGGELGQTISFLLPYGAGQSHDIAKQFTYKIKHEYAKGQFDNYSTERKSEAQIKAEFTDKGILLTGIKSFSPFTVQWVDKEVETVGVSGLPSTGDSSNLMLFALLLMGSIAGAAAMKKRGEQK